jgi:predicted nucleotidyltransferase
VFGRDVQVVTLTQLIHLKRAAGRPKDLEAIAELEALAEEQRRAE